MSGKNSYKQNLMALTAALIWGTGFVAQSHCADRVGPNLLNGVRAFIAVLCLLGVLALRRGREQKRAAGETGTAVKRRLFTSDPKALFLGSLCCGVFLTLGSVLQQWGITYTAAGKAGFITALYVVLVPVLGLLLMKKQVSRLIWFAVVLALAGLYFLCVPKGEQMAINKGDLLVFFSAFAFAGQILCVDRFLDRVDCVELSWGQFAVLMVLCLILAPILEKNSWEGFVSSLPYILYLGVFCFAVGFTLQNLAQKGGNPTVVSLLLCLESFFAVVSAALLLGDRLKPREYLGCGLMLGAVLLCQLPAPGEGKKKGEG